MRYMTRLFIGAASLSCMAASLVAQSGASSTNPVVLPTSAVTGAVSGHIYVTLADGSSQDLRGAEVFLLCGGQEIQNRIGSLEASMTQAGTNLRAVLSSPDDGPEAQGRYVGAAGFGGEYMPRVAKAYGDALIANAIRTGRSTYDGTYRFDSLPPGDYIVVSRYSTNAALGYWHVSVTISAGSTAETDLATFNIFDVHAALAIDRIVEAQSLAVQWMSEGAALLHVPASQTIVGRTLAQQRALGTSTPVPAQFLTKIGNRACVGTPQLSP